MSKITLSEYSLYSDGDIEIPSEKLSEWLMHHPGIHPYLDKVTNDIVELNRALDEPFTIKSSERPLDLSWNIPGQYAEVDIDDIVYDRLLSLDVTSEEMDSRMRRVAKELVEFHRRGLYDMLRVLNYVVDTMEKAQIPWGVGRGSSVSSYVLYLLRVHDIDSFRHDLDFHDFIR